MITALIVFVAVFLFLLGALGVWLWLRRDDNRDPFAQAALTVTPVDGFADLGPMPAEIAHDEFLAAPLPEMTYRPDPGVLSEYPPPPPPAPRTIRLPESSRVHLPPVTGPAMAVLAAITAPIRERAAAIEQAKADAFHAEALAVFPEWKPWAGDDTITHGFPAIKAGA